MTPELMQEPQPPRLNFDTMLTSLFVPGLGQLFQKRHTAFFCHFFLFLIGAFSSFVLPHFLVLSALLAAFSAVDAALWIKDTPNRMYRPMELLGVVMLFAGFIAFVFPTVQAAREAARRMQCVPKQIAVAFHNYHDTYGSLPPAYTVDENDKPLHSWRVLLLPFIEQQELYKKIRLDEPWDSEYNRQFHETDPVWFRIYRCPSGSPIDGVYKRFPDLKKGNCHYSVIIGPDTPFPGAESTKFSDCTDGLSNTLLFVERMTPICWMDPNNEITFDTACDGVNRNLMGIGSAHPGGANCSFMDGGCPFLPEGVELKPFLTKSGSEKVTWEMLRRK